MTNSWKVRVDTGGTFTDAWALTPEGIERRCKVLSDGSLVARIQNHDADGWLDLGWSPGFDDAGFIGFPLETGGKILAARENGRWLQVSQLPPHDRLILRTGEEAPVLAARLLTGTPFPEKLPPMDFRVATTRGTNALLEGKGAPTVLFITRGFGDLPLIRDQRRPLLFSLSQPEPESLCSGVVEISARLDSSGNLLETPDESEIRASAREWLAKGISVAAVAVLHAWKNPDLEQKITSWLLDEGFSHVTTSSGVSPVIRFLPRLETAVADAWLAPVMRAFTRSVSAAMSEGEPWMMTSAGGLVPASRYQPKDSLLSGPAGGLVGAEAIARAAGFPQVLTFDMGGTSTDVARLDGPFSYRYEQEIGPARVLAPAMKIETVAAGGGSICRWHLGRLEVGPESAGAFPGPACYGRGGPLTVTDVNLLLGLMQPEGAGIPLDPAPARDKLSKLMDAMERDGISPPSEHELLEGLRAIAIEKMAEAIRSVSLAEGHLPEKFTLFAFGGAGPQHACAVAENLGIERVLVPGDAGLLSAWGLDQARRQEQAVRQILAPLAETDCAFHWHELARQVSCNIPNPAFRWLAQLRLLGQDTPLEIEVSTPECPLAEMTALFESAYRQLYGYAPTSTRPIECASLRVIAEEPSLFPREETFGEIEAHGPRIIQDRFSTCVLPAGWSLRRGQRLTILLEKNHAFAQVRHDAEIRAALFRSRFEGLVREMGGILRRTALSTNVKERLDYSCALLDAAGRLVVNAPHVPVHLGALGVCVREVAARIDFQPGDVVVTNHPAAGGSHLPDVTLIAAAFDEAGNKIGYVANRAHHAEIGGIAPGSMPAAARNLAEEGVVIFPFKWITAGETPPLDLFTNAPYPSRRPVENLADLEAQAASVAHGVRVLESLAANQGADTVRAEMSGILDRSAALMRNLLARYEGREFSRSETLDDGAPLRVSIRIENGALTLDFTGTGPVHPRNLNATPAIVRSVILYVLRLWLNEDVPLNEGLLERVTLHLPRCFLNPEFPENPELCPAVVGGNVETSQRLTDLLLAALDLCAHGPGTMNNFLFGNDAFGYYETIAGGSGAGPTFHGADSHHVHMTNTAITDPEILEHRFPVRLHRFERRKNSGGNGKHRGGDGVTREVEFLVPMKVSFLTERRLSAPQGLHGGENGAPGSQTRVFPDGSRENLPGAVTYQADAGERVIIRTPGGGGWE
ncbi:MAG: hydantoinase B/oxoprolinase family protein [Luteolibacter sp.]